MSSRKGYAANGGHPFVKAFGGRKRKISNII
jgi:hypothetical protein